MHAHTIQHPTRSNSLFFSYARTNIRMHSFVLMYSYVMHVRIHKASCVVKHTYMHTHIRRADGGSETEGQEGLRRLSLGFRERCLAGFRSPAIRPASTSDGQGIQSFRIEASCPAGMPGKPFGSLLWEWPWQSLLELGISSRGIPSHIITPRAAFGTHIAPAAGP